MPTYTYACKACAHQFDIHQAFTDDSLTVCPECSGSLRKVLNKVGVVFKGSGFYRTDSRAQADKSAAGKKTGASSGSDSGGSSSASGSGDSGGSGGGTSAPATPAAATPSAAPATSSS